MSNVYERNVLKAIEIDIFDLDHLELSKFVLHVLQDLSNEFFINEDYRMRWLNYENYKSKPRLLYRT